MDIYELCGYTAGVLFASGFIPQVYKSYKTKNMEDIFICLAVYILNRCNPRYNLQCS